jgi:opacity protein-like surface antigen
MKKIYFLLIVFTVVFVKNSFSQDLLDEFGPDVKTKAFTYATFKTSRIIIGQSIENPAKGNLNFSISHHFGAINEGSYGFFGLDQSTIRIGLEYGVNNRLSIGLGRSSLQKTFDGFVKYKIVRQTIDNSMPVSVSYFCDLAINGLHFPHPEWNNYFSSRMSFVHQLLIARKFSNSFSFQITPSLVHKNLVTLNADPNDIVTLGGGGRYKLSKRMSVNAEYHYIMSSETRKNYDNSLSLGLDIETGGHVFQLFVTNSQPLFERGFLTETQGSWGKGYIYFGFNIVRTFTIVKPKGFK